MSVQNTESITLTHLIAPAPPAKILLLGLKNTASTATSVENSLMKEKGNLLTLLTTTTAATYVLTA